MYKNKRKIPAKLSQNYRKNNLKKYQLYQFTKYQISI
jgi:hypothetical protein